jgi:lipopolysaccharide heptosyltransferase II
MNADARASVRRILVTRLRYLGDVVLSTPLLGALRESFPEARIEYLTFARYAPVLAHHPWVDRVHALPDDAKVVATLRMAMALRRPRIDWWLDLFGNPRSALLCALARPAHSVGPARGIRSRVFGHRRPGPAHSPSAIEHHLDKAVPLLGRAKARRVHLEVAPAELDSIRHTFPELSTQQPVLLHPGATWPSKAWPAAKWSALIDALRRVDLGPIWILSVAGEEELSARVAQKAGAECRVIPPLSLRPLLALIASARAYVGNDGGVLHCAVGLSTPTVGIFGPTEREIWFPHEDFGGCRLVQEEVPCRPCHLHECSHLSCLRALPVARVVASLRALLEESAGTGNSSRGGLVAHG